MSEEKTNEDITELKVENIEMKNVEVLQSGTWNNINVTEKDLDEMVNNFNNGVIEPYLNLDHDDKFTDNVKKALSVVSLGFVSQLRREGKKLIANFKEVPRKVAELIDSGMLKKRSVEFFKKGFRLNGKVYNNVLKAVSFFGADIPAVNSLSNDFDVLLKSKEHAISFQDDNASEKIIFHNGGNKMETLEVSKKEYDALISFKTESSSEITSLKNEVSDLEIKLKDVESDNKKLKDIQEKYEAEKATNLEKEATEFVSKIINDGKLMPKFKQDKIDDYITKASDESKLSLFKDDLESRDKVIELGAITDDLGNIVKSVENMSNDEISDAIEAKMKKTGKAWEEIAPEFGLSV